MPATASSDPAQRRGLLRALLDAIGKEDNRIGGRAITRLLGVLTETDAAAFVESTIGFGENTDDLGDAKFLINGEVITATGRTSAEPFEFSGLARGGGGTTAKIHPVGSLVYDLSRNASALDHLRRGFFVDTAIGEDLDIIGRNLGLPKCPGLSQEQWRRIIKATAYLPKQTDHAFYETLNAYFDDDTHFAVYERLLSDPWTVFAEIAVGVATSLRGRFCLNGGEPHVTTGLTTVVALYDVIEPAFAAYPGYPDLEIAGRTITYPAGGVGTETIGVYLDTIAARRGKREGMTNYASGGSVAGATITLGSSPGAIGTAVLVDYAAFSAHYLATDETERDSGDMYAYLADPLLTARCLLDHIRAAGVAVELSMKL